MISATSPGCIRYTYAWGYTSRARAVEAIENMIAEAEISPAERPMVKRYTGALSGRRLYAVTLEGIV